MFYDLIECTYPAYPGICEVPYFFSIGTPSSYTFLGICLHNMKYTQYSQEQHKISVDLQTYQVLSYNNKFIRKTNGIIYFKLQYLIKINNWNSFAYHLREIGLNTRRLSFIPPIFWLSLPNCVLIFKSLLKGDLLLCCLNLCRSGVFPTLCGTFELPANLPLNGETSFR